MYLRGQASKVKSRQITRTCQFLGAAVAALHIRCEAKSADHNLSDLSPDLQHYVALSLATPPREQEAIVSGARLRNGMQVVTPK
jgi:hypothetical protein